MARRGRFLVVLLLCLPLAGCPAFALPRPAQIEPGVSVTGSLIAMTPPGDAASWFWSFDCVSNCNHASVAPALFVRAGVGEARPRGELGLGVGGTSVYVEGYGLLSDPDARAWGLGGRLSLPPQYGASEVFARINLRESEERTLFLNPTYAVHAADGRQFHAFFLAIGTHEEDDGGGMTLALTPAVSYTRRPDAYGAGEREAWSAFVVLSGSYSVRFGWD